MAILLNGCASLGPRTEGVTGPIAWRVTDLRAETREIKGQLFEGRAFTLVVRNVSAETITFTRMDERRFQPRSNGATSSST
jgi:hypothetical protein